MQYTLTNWKIKPSQVVKRATETRRPMFLSSSGRVVAVIQAISDLEKAENDQTCMRDVVQGPLDIDARRVESFEGVKYRFGL